MEILDTNLIVEKNKLTGDEPWLITLDVQLSDTETIYLVRNTEDITFDGRTYQAFPLEIDERNQVTQGNIPTLGVRVSNVNRLIQSYLEDYGGLVDNEITLRVLSRLDTTWYEAIAFTYKILGCVADAMYVNFTLGAANPLNRRFPLYKYISNHCNWQFGGAECNYTFDYVGTWTASKRYWVGDLIRPTAAYTGVYRTDLYSYRCIFPGRTGLTEPSWSTVTCAKFTEDDAEIHWMECSLTTWTATRRYYEGDIVHGTTVTSTSQNYRALNEGVSGSGQPNWPSRLGSTILDGTVAGGITWTVNTCKRSLRNCRDLGIPTNFGGHPGLSGKGMKVV